MPVLLSGGRLSLDLRHQA